MKRVLLTGGTGFVGANLTRRLLQDGHELHLLIYPGSDLWRLKTIQSEVRLYETDLADVESLTSLVQQIRPDWIFHLAVHGAYSYQTDLSRMVQTNILGTINLVQACLKAGFAAFVNTGSSSEYGFKAHAPAETDWLEPNSYYAVTKASATLFCAYTAQSQGVHLPTLRLYSVYGAYEEPSRLMPTLILQGFAGKFPPLVNPAIARDYVYAEDINQAYILAASQPNQKPGAVYNVGTGVQTSLRQVVEVAKQVLDIPGEPVWGSMPDRHWDSTTWVADSRRIQTELGWQPRYTFEQGFRQMVDWFRENPEILSHYKASRS
jgi:UDP-glucose 4-epimerase